MTNLRQLSRYLEFANLPQAEKKEISNQMLPSVTISRMAGSRGDTIIEKLLNKLNERKKAPVWEAYNKTLLAKILEKNKWPKNYLPYLEESKYPSIERAIEEMMGLHPSLELLQTRCNKAIKDIATMGYAIIVGRGANFVLKNQENNLNIRIIGSFDKRLRRFMYALKITKKEAEKLVREKDKKQKKFIKTWFKAEVDDPAMYDMVINTDSFEDDQVVDVLLQAISSLNQNGISSREISVFTQVV